MMDRNEVTVAQTQKADVAVRVCTFYPVGNSNDTESNCLSACTLGAVDLTVARLGYL